MVPPVLHLSTHQSSAHGCTCTFYFLHLARTIHYSRHDSGTKDWNTQEQITQFEEAQGGATAHRPPSDLQKQPNKINQ
jgi:hypothetical protein